MVKRIVVILAVVVMIVALAIPVLGSNPDIENDFNGIEGLPTWTHVPPQPPFKTIDWVKEIENITKAYQAHAKAAER